MNLGLLYFLFLLLFFLIYIHVFPLLQVSNNGIISFKDRLRTDMYRPLNFDDRKLNNKVPFIAPYWADVDIEHVTGLNETVLYRITYNDSQILNRSTEDIRNYFDIYSANTTDFSAELVLIVTWYNVGFYGASDEGLKLVSWRRPAFKN